jgi:hypothetical protein
MQNLGEDLSETDKEWLARNWAAIPLPIRDLIEDSLGFETRNEVVSMALNPRLMEPVPPPSTSAPTE